MPNGRDGIELAATFADVARTLSAEADEQTTLQRIVDLAIETIDGCDHAGVMLLEERSISTPALSDEVPARVDALQLETGQGPCLEAIRERQTVWVADLSAESRWPLFAARAFAETGVRTMLSFRLVAARDTMGSLSLFSHRADAFDRDDEALGSIFAAHAAVAMSHARTVGQLREAVANRDAIGKAKGILMARRHVTEDQAFDMLRRASQRLNVKLRVVATRVAQTGESPEEIR